VLGSAKLDVPVVGPHEETDYRDTFFDAAHLRESFPDAEMTFTNLSDSASTYRLAITRGQGEPDKIEATAYTQPLIGPYPPDAPRCNPTRFTPRQVEAIRSGVNEGLTVVVGPPGTGKSDVAVQIASLLYHNHPTQKILLVAHSNAALNDLFAKIHGQTGIDPRHLLRLGGGERDLTLRDGSEDVGVGEQFSKQGRVNWSLQRRIDMLAEVQRLAESLAVPGDVGYSCETAAFFYREHIIPRINRFHAEVAAPKETPQNVAGHFPFKEFFNDVTETLFKGKFTQILEDVSRYIDDNTLIVACKYLVKYS
jgi:intron-binding protein aquarius